ncbi:hypothetical protein ACFLIN_03860 [Corynebacterium kutscheri]|uniref:hypothetical protein n=1 Tax=Corynebacterium kutscheri TaxID=35755 RepID=UPI0037C121F8
MTWLTKEILTELINETSRFLNKITHIINENNDDVPGWLHDDPRLQETTPAPQPAPQPAPEPVPQPAPKPAVLPDDTPGLNEAKTLLRTISTTEGNTWITQTLFPHFHITNLAHITTDQLPELINIAEAHLEKTRP